MDDNSLLHEIPVLENKKPTKGIRGLSGVLVGCAGLGPASKGLKVAAAGLRQAHLASQSESRHEGLLQERQIE